MIAALSEYIRKGNYAVTACQLCDIEESTYYDWIDYAKQDLKAGKESIYTSLYKSLKKAEADAEDLMVQTARNAAIQKRDGYLAMTVNERRHPDRWGRRERRDVNINETKTINITRIEVLMPQVAIPEVIEGEVREIIEGGDGTP